jgi:hypothetical protein
MLKFKRVRCPDCAHYPGAGKLCRIAKCHATKVPRGCAAFSGIPRPTSVRVPDHGFVVVAEAPPLRLSDGTQTYVIARPRFAGRLRSTPSKH